MANIQFKNDRAFYLSGNPILIGIKGEHYRIKTGTDFSTVLFDGVCPMSYFEPNDYFWIDVRELMEGLDFSHGVVRAKIVMVNEDDEEIGIGENTPDGSTVFTVFKGGISNQLIRNLEAEGTDIFSLKLKNNDGNFLLTTRTNGRNIYIPENELLPLRYYGTGMKYDIYNGDDLIFSADHTAETEEKLFSLDLQQLRKQVAQSFLRLVSEFRFIIPDQGGIFNVYITESKKMTKYQLEFINSFGAAERIAIEGDLNYQESFEEKDRSRSFDAVIYDFVEKDFRKKSVHEYTANLGVRNAGESEFISDLLHSDEIWLIIDNKYKFRVFVTAENFSPSNTLGMPVNVTVKLTLTDSDKYYFPLLTEDDLLYLTSGGENVTATQSDILVNV